MTPTAALALLRAHALVLGAPGADLLRLRGEAAVRARGWRLVDVPQDADLLLVCGAATGAFAEAVQHTWAAVPVPRVRRTVVDEEGLVRALDSAARVLGDDALQRATPAGPPPARPEAHTGRIRFGPAARGWPSGLELDCRLDRRGRVADVLVVRDERQPPGRDAAAGLARAAVLLRLAGWPTQSARVDGLVDRLLAGATPEEVARPARRIAALVERSVTLRLALAADAPLVRDAIVVLLRKPTTALPRARDWERLLGGHRPASVPLLVVAGAPRA